MSKSMFIVIEGIDGSGKSTQIDLLQKRFQAEGKKAMITHEPTDGPIGKLIRSILNGHEEVDASVMAALYLADRLDHIKNQRSCSNRILRYRFRFYLLF